MAILKIFDEAANLLSKSDDLPEIQSKLAPSGVTIEQWKYLSAEALSDIEVLSLYEKEIERIKSIYGFKAVDLMAISPEFARRDDFMQMREKFLKEHTHTDDEVRYFISGSGLFTVHYLDKVYSILCSAGDFIGVPANTLHWFDMGAEPQFKCLRFFSDEGGWVPCYSESSISLKFDLLDNYA